VLFFFPGANYVLSFSIALLVLLQGKASFTNFFLEDPALLPLLPDYHA